MSKKQSFIRQHSLSITSAVILAVWTIAYIYSDPETHLGSFFGNAIADWTGLLVTVLATKFFYEKGSAESKKPPHPFLKPVWEIFEEHSLTIFLVLTGLGWVWLYASMSLESKWGQVVG